MSRGRLTGRRPRHELKYVRAFGLGKELRDGTTDASSSAQLNQRSVGGANATLTVQERDDSGRSVDHISKRGFRLLKRAQIGFVFRNSLRETFALAA